MPEVTTRELSLSAVARTAGICRHAAIRLARNNRIPGLIARGGPGTKRWRFDAAIVEAWLDEQVPVW